VFIAEPGSIAFANGAFFHRQGISNMWAMSAFIDASPKGCTASWLVVKDDKEWDLDLARRYHDANKMYT